LAISAKEMGLEINTNKTKLLVQSRRANKQIYITIVMEETIESVKDFVCLVSNQSTNAVRRMRSEEDFVRHCNPSWYLEEYSQIKIRLYKTVTRSGSWTLAEKSESILDAAENITGKNIWPFERKQCIEN
jgi:hypothetical protein